MIREAQIPPLEETPQTHIFPESKEKKITDKIRKRKLFDAKSKESSKTQLSHPIKQQAWETYLRQVWTIKGKRLSSAQGNCDLLADALTQGSVTGYFIS